MVAEMSGALPYRNERRYTHKSRNKATKRHFLFTYRRKIIPANAIGCCGTSCNLMESYFPCRVRDDIIGHLTVDDIVSEIERKRSPQTE